MDHPFCLTPRFEDLGRSSACPDFRNINVDLFKKMGDNEFATTLHIDRRNVADATSITAITIR